MIDFRSIRTGDYLKWNAKLQWDYLNLEDGSFLEDVDHRNIYSVIERVESGESWLIELSEINGRAPNILMREDEFDHYSDCLGAPILVEAPMSEVFSNYNSEEINMEEELENAMELIKQA